MVADVSLCRSSRSALPSLAKNPDILLYVCGIEMATMLLSGHSIPQLLANGKIGLTALADLSGVSRVMATSFIELAHTLTTPKEDGADISSEDQLLPVTEYRLTNPLNRE
jgi:hypothetical protein